MFAVIKKENYQKSLWKNGKGITEQIAISPSTASLQQNNFEWRISSAQIKSDDFFSQFPNYQRQLVILGGDGVKLNETNLPLNSPHKFSGDEKMFCQLINNSPAVDFGIIYQDKFHVELEVLFLTGNSELKLLDGLHFLYLASGHDCLINEVSLKVGNSLKISDEKSIFINTTGNSPLTFCHIRLI